MQIRGLKKGVSLVTVLIFMMVATIAATATYKWLSSVGFTSADRMAIAEAKESSRGGLDAVRSWMTYHANDVGAIIRQYYDGGKKPVSLNSLVHSDVSDKQRFSVWLTGVETAGSTYKFTIVSTGTSRTDSKYSETSVLNVRGLYKVKIPVQTVHKPLEFDYSYFGGTTQSRGTAFATSMLINGKWNGNPVNIDSTFVVTGDVELNGHNLKGGINTCIGGAFNAMNKGFSGRNIYVHKNTSNFGGTIGGDAYFNGSLGRSEADSMVASGDFLVNGNFETVGRAQNNTIKGNFCLGGQLDVYGLQHKFLAASNVLFQHNKPISGANSQNYSSGALVLGGENYSMYIQNAALCNSGEPNNYCLDAASSPRAFISYANKAYSITDDMLCSESSKNYCLSSKMLGSEKVGCDTCCGANFKVADMIASSYDSFKGWSGPCSDTSVTEDSLSMSVLNNCYVNAKSASQLFHGFLVVKLNPDGGIFDAPKDSLDGNFIFYAETSIPELRFPITTERSNVFVYLKNGATKINTNEDIGPRNYFFFSDGDVEFLENAVKDVEKRTWSGSFYMSAHNCSKIESINSDSMQISFNEGLVQTLLDSTIICNISEADSCGKIVTYGSDSTNTAGEYDVVGYDIYYVATAPQLSISLESQRRNKAFVEPTDYTTIKPSIVVMPRIVYLSDTPKGRLSDYYNVINLNGATEKRNVSKTRCSPSLDPTGILATPPEKLEGNVYRCEYEPENTDYGKNHFWVVVDGNFASKSTVTFGTNYVRMFAGNELWTDVELIVGTQQSNPVTVTISMDEVPSNWMVDSSFVTPLGGGRFTVTINPGATKTVFKVKTPSNAAKNMLTFRIDELSSNAMIGTNSYETLQLLGEGTVIREPISDAFCVENGNKIIKGVSCTDIDTIPDCEGSLLNGIVQDWIRPNINECSEVTKNREWRCNFTSPQVKLVEGISSPYCEIYNYGDSIVNPLDGYTYYLHASYKAKMVTINLKVEGATYSDVDVRISSGAIDSTVAPQRCDGGNTCTYRVPANYNMHFYANQKGGEKFSKWIITGSDPESEVTSNEEALRFIALTDTLITAVFNDKDSNHCFYSDFVNTRIWCSTHADSTDDCVDVCNKYYSGSKFDKHDVCATESSDANSDLGSRNTSYWVLTRTNFKDTYCKPLKDSDMFLYYYAPKNGGCAEDENRDGVNNNNNNATVAYLLNRAEAGAHGKMTARFKTCSYGGSNKNLNSGFILRASSISSHYAVVNILGFPTGKKGNELELKARICHGTGDGVNNESECDNTLQSLGIIIPEEQFSQQVFNAEIEVPLDRDYAIILLSYKNGDSWVQSPRISIPLPVSGKDRAPRESFVGASMADKCFKLGNIGWESYDFDGGCETVPKLSCSFAANYMGGLLPKESDVTPWIGTSTWFRDSSNLDNPFAIRKECALSYHYNGGDVPGSLVKSNGQFSSSVADTEARNRVLMGKTARTMKTETYQFTAEGLHGYLPAEETFSGRIRDASVVMDCGILGVFTESCGEFNVGTITSCSQNVEFNTSCNNAKSCVATPSNGGYVNLRSAKILGEISGIQRNSDGTPYSVEMELVDSAGLTSQVFTISADGEFQHTVDLYADMYGFNPERIAFIKFTSSGEFSVMNLRSDCPYAFGVDECSARLVNGHIEVSSVVKNPMMASCELHINGSAYRTDETCPLDGLFEVNPSDLSGYINIDGQYDFSIVMKSKSDETATDYCLTNKVSLDAPTSSSSGESSSSESSSSVSSSSVSSSSAQSSSSVKSSSSSAPATVSATCAFYENNGSTPVSSGKGNKKYMYKVTGNINGDYVRITCGNSTYEGMVYAGFTPDKDFASAEPRSITCSATYNGKTICNASTFSWTKNGK